VRGQPLYHCKICANLTNQCSIGEFSGQVNIFLEQNEQDRYCSSESYEFKQLEGIFNILGERRELSQIRTYFARKSLVIKDIRNEGS